MNKQYLDAAKTIGFGMLLELRFLMVEVLFQGKPSTHMEQVCESYLLLALQRSGYLMLKDGDRTYFSKDGHLVDTMDAREEAVTEIATAAGRLFEERRLRREIKRGVVIHVKAV